MFICKNVILYVFLKMLQKYCKLVILGTLDIPGYAHLKKIVSTILQRYVYKIFILGTLGMYGYGNPK